ncbi:signal peptidase II [Paenibacillus xanthanilyticus]|uniref:Lipoprotein signal peptidase n=1 Tax=Paenibacillus xanthanilyticus TaxID=1783531 RepID=A0ABV8K1F7_9BACL
MFYWLSISLTAVDLISKLFVRYHMDVGDTKVFREGLLHFTYYQNSGAAGSSFQGYGRLFGVIAVLFIAFVVIYRKRRTDASGVRLQDAGFAFLVAGAAGNGIERLLQGKVTDFLQFRPDGGILNIADLFINVGVVILIGQLLYESIRAKMKAA